MTTIYPYGCQRGCNYDEGFADGSILALMAILVLSSMYSLADNVINCYRQPKAWPHYLNE